MINPDGAVPAPEVGPEGLGDDETLLVQSGRAVGVVRTHEEAPRVLISNAMLVPAEAVKLNDEKRGVWVYYRVNAGALSDLAALLGGVGV